MLKLAVLLALAASCTGCGVASPQTEPQAHPLLAPVQTAPKALSAAGAVVGGLRPAVDTLPAFLYEGAKPGADTDSLLGAIPGQELPVPSGATWVLPTAINGRGQIVGFANEPMRQTNHAVLWNALRRASGQEAALQRRQEPKKELQICLLDDGGAISSEATAINNRGEIVGVRWTRDGVCHACYWRDGLLRDLAPQNSPQNNFQNNARNNLQNKLVWRPTGLNDAGDIVGWGLDAFNKAHLYSWRHQVLTDLGRGYQIALNQRGQMAGDYETQEHHFYACLWKGSQRIPLPRLPGATESHALALNDRGQIVGRATRSTTYPVLWEGGRAIDLNTLLPSQAPYVLEEAIAINDAGQILCTARQGLWGRAVLLTPGAKQWAAVCF